MKLVIDTTAQTLTRDAEGESREMALYSKEAFELIAQQWLKVGWSQKYEYSFSWMGRPIIQLPEDMIRMQEVLYRIQPDVIIETGVAHGGSLIYYASLCKVMGKGRVVGIDIEIRPHNRQAIEEHDLFSFITLVEGSSTDEGIVRKVKEMINPGEIVLVILDSCHTREHVLAELAAYHPMVTPGSYIVATDGIMRDLYDVPLGQPEWRTDNPEAAAREFVAGNPHFRIEEPAFPFNEGTITERLTHWPSAYIKKVQ